MRSRSRRGRRHGRWRLLAVAPPFGRSRQTNAALVLSCGYMILLVDGARVSSSHLARSWEWVPLGRLRSRSRRGRRHGRWRLLAVAPLFVALREPPSPAKSATPLNRRPGRIRDIRPGRSRWGTAARPSRLRVGGSEQTEECSASAAGSAMATPDSSNSKKSCHYPKTDPHVLNFYFFF